jgi:hypothetical protein
VFLIASIVFHYIRGQLHHMLLQPGGLHNPHPAAIRQDKVGRLSIDRQLVNLEIRIVGAALDKRMSEQTMCAQIIDSLRAAFKMNREKMPSRFG